ncbi:4-alpha-glucanotransferase [Rheinheimera metallidurans]|uniref:4-alpha-glucanotransferase n=1 Tax=Rheinheimera metallidurans TaxID=2925781 RepID=UPI003002FBE9
MDAGLIAELTAFCGIETEYTDAWGKHTAISDIQQLALLKAHGFDTEDEESAQLQLLMRQLDFWLRPLQAVSVQQSDEPHQLLIQVALAQANEPLALLLTREDGQTHSFSLTPVDGELTQMVVLDEDEYHQYQHALPLQLPVGYHQLQVVDGVATQSVIISSGVCYQPDAVKGQQLKRTALQLYGLSAGSALGVDAALSETLGSTELHCVDASIGSPPSLIEPSGINLNIAPIYPYQLYRQAYQPFIDLLRTNMHGTNVLHIENIMALLRLWWLPKTEQTVGAGAYVYYPFMDLLGVLALESQRNNVLITCNKPDDAPEGMLDILQAYGVAVV